MKYDIEINGEIGWWPDTKGEVRGKLAKLSSQQVAVRISSPGGSVADALDIFQQFRDHGNVTAYLYGPVASAATIIAMGAQKIVMSRYALMLVHKVSNWVDEWGYFNADQLDELIKDLQKTRDDNDRFDNVLVAIYCNRSGKSAAEIKSLLSEDRWMTAEEARKLGLVDEIAEDGKQLKVDNRVNDALEMLGYPRVPLQQQEGGRLAELMRDLLAALKGKKEQEQQDNGQTEYKDQHNPDKTMNEAYTSLHDLLGIAGLETADDGTAQLSVQQLEAINKALAGAAQARTDLDAANDRIADLEQQVKDLKDQPAVEDDPQPEQEEDKTDYLALAIKASIY